MSEKKTKFEFELDRLIKKGVLLRHAIEFECLVEEIERRDIEENKNEKTKELLEGLPNFKTEYQA